jgi:putative DNA primase/helicase
MSNLKKATNTSGNTPKNYSRTDDDSGLSMGLDLRFNADNIPKSMRSLPQWCVWGRRKQNGIDVHTKDKKSVEKLNKAPFNPITGKAACSNKPPTWASFDDAVNAYNGGMYNGVGFFFNYETDGMAGIDLDHCLKEGQLTSDARCIVEHFPNTYLEISPSGDGLHIYVLGMPEHCGKGKKNKWIESYGRAVDTGKKSPRYFCVTGNLFEGANSSITDGQEGLAWLHETFKAGAEKPKSTTQPTPVDPNKPKSTTQTTPVDPNNEQQLVEDALAYIYPDNSYDDWIAIGMALKDAGYSIDVWESWSSTGSKYNAGECPQKWNSFNRKGIGIGTLFELAKQNGYQFPKHITHAATQSVETPQTNDDNVFLKPTDKGPKLPVHSQAIDFLKSRNYLGNVLFDSKINNWFYYEDGVWRASYGGNNTLKSIDAALQDLTQPIGFSMNYLKSLGELASIRLSIEAWNRDKKLIPFKNGVLDTQTKQLHPHQPEKHLTWQIPFDYNLSATCDPILAWFNEICEGDTAKIEILRAFLNAAVTGKAYLQKYLELIGPGGTGKGTFLWLAQKLVGDENCHATDLKSLASNRFETAALYEKRLVLLSDEARYSGDMAIFKSITGQDALKFEKKGKDAGIPFVFDGIVMLAANEPLQSSDYTSGITRRRVSLTLNHQPKTRRDLRSEFEKFLPGLLNWVLGISDKRVDEILLGNKLNLDTLCATNPLALWLFENVYHAPAMFTPVGRYKLKRHSIQGTGSSVSEDIIEDSDEKLYPNYRAFCKEHGIIRPLPLKRFSDLLLDLCQNQLKLSGVSAKRTNQARGILGLSFSAGNKIGETDSDVIVTDGDGRVTDKVTATSPQKWGSDGSDGSNRGIMNKKNNGDKE